MQANNCSSILSSSNVYSKLATLLRNCYIKQDVSIMLTATILTYLNLSLFPAIKHAPLLPPLTPALPVQTLFLSSHFIPSFVLTYMNYDSKSRIN